MQPNFRAINFENETKTSNSDHHQPYNSDFGTSKIIIKGANSMFLQLQIKMNSLKTKIQLQKY